MDIRKMNAKQVNTYEKKCNIIKNLISNDYKNNKFKFIKNPETLYIEIIIDNNSKITLLPDNNWKEIKRHINKKITYKASVHNGSSDNCPICYEAIKMNVTCPKCSNNYCSECYINIFKEGKGIITCPHCRFSYGNRMSEHMIQIGVDEINYKLGKY